MKPIILRYYFAELLRPIISRAPFGAGILYRLLLGNEFASHRVDQELRDCIRNLKRVFYDRRIGAFVNVDLGDWAGREHYFTGRYQDRLVPALIQYFLSEGGVFVDIGANRGLHTLSAANLLQDIDGEVYAFEPNPQAYKILVAHLVFNGFDFCRTYNIGLSDAKGILGLHIPSHSGQASFRDDITFEKEVSVNVETLDDVLGSENPRGPVLVKIDTEGYEHHVLKGMKNLLNQTDLSVVCEVTDKWLRNTGTSAQLLFEDMHGHGFNSYLCSLRKIGSAKNKIQFKEIAGPQPNITQYDVLFTRK